MYNCSFIQNNDGYSLFLAERFTWLIENRTTKRLSLPADKIEINGRDKSQLEWYPGLHVYTEDAVKPILQWPDIHCPLEYNAPYKFNLSATWTHGRQGLIVLRPTDICIYSIPLYTGLLVRSTLLHCAQPSQTTWHNLFTNFCFR